MIDLAEKQTTCMERDWEDVAWIYQKRIKERDLWSASYLFASCNFSRVGVVGFKAKSDTCLTADRLESIRGIHWLCSWDLRREGSILVSLSLYI